MLSIEGGGARKNHRRLSERGRIGNICLARRDARGRILQGKDYGSLLII